jgi:REP element-mobilizing transposase RayT
VKNNKKMTFNPQIHHRKSIRLKGYDYSKNGLYFITLCVEDKQHLFGEIIDGKMILNQLGQIANDEWLNTSNIRDNISLHEFIIMPNHFHCIIEINFKKGQNDQSIGAFKSPSQTIGSIIRGYKIATTKKIKDFLKEESIRTGELQFAPIFKSISGESEIAQYSNSNSGESEIAHNSQSNSGELQFAPTALIGDPNKKIWQRNYYENIIRDEKAYQNISNYIKNNPAKWHEDKFSKHFQL